MKDLTRTESKYINKEGLENIKKYKYSGICDSYVYNKILSPFIENYLMNYFPMWMAPNFITLISFVFNLIAFVVISFELGNDYTTPLSRFSCLLKAISHLIYLILDNADGKQARRTGSSSPLGMLFDHGLDTYTSWLVAFDMSHILLLGNTGYQSFAAFFFIYLTFWMETYQEYITGTLYLGQLGPDEANSFVILISLVSAIIGPEKWNNEIYFGLTYTQGFIILYTVSTVINTINFVLTLSKLKNSRTFFVMFYDSINMLVILLLPFFSVYYDSEFFSNNFTLIMHLISVNYCRIIIELQIKIVTKHKTRTILIVALTNLLYLVTLVCFKWSDDLIKYRPTIIYVMIIINLLSLLEFCYVCMRQIKNYLGIKVFTIDYPKNY